jgi:hypothetical protein
MTTETIGLKGRSGRVRHDASRPAGAIGRGFDTVESSAPSASNCWPRIQAGSGDGKKRTDPDGLCPGVSTTVPPAAPYSQVLILSDDGERKASALRGFSLGGEASATRSMNAEVRIFVHCKNTTPREKGDDRICPVAEPPDVSRDSHCGLGRLALAPSTLVWQAWKTAIDFRP